MRMSVMGPACSNYHEGSELCNIASGHPISPAQRVLNNIMLLGLQNDTKIY